MYRHSQPMYRHSQPPYRQLSTEWRPPLDLSSPFHTSHTLKSLPPSHPFPPSTSLSPLHVLYMRPAQSSMQPHLNFGENVYTGCVPSHAAAMLTTSLPGGTFSRPACSSSQGPLCGLARRPGVGEGCLKGAIYWPVGPFLLALELAYELREAPVEAKLLARCRIRAPHRTAAPRRTLVPRGLCCAELKLPCWRAMRAARARGRGRADDACRADEVQSDQTASSLRTGLLLEGWRCLAVKETPDFEGNAGLRTKGRALEEGRESEREKALQAHSPVAEVRTPYY
eukprot:252976-Chlamydomonas_euryale.AAC.3